MNMSIRTILYWAPRVLGIFFALFISVFALDVFTEGYRFWETVVALFMHLIPTAIVLLVLFISWRREQIGGALFLALGLFYIVAFWNPTRWQAYLIISGPLFLIGVLFLLSWRYGAERVINSQ
jgi:hypothetical protein